ncbi:glycosyltransferase [Affinirhizobium pseudoryzae]|uniref:glycosyltransferase n=1 Tax=Allorhizobium pseudoryzae TaxID=379684 RepID=UPI0013EBB85F|nr:glycosyltransferase [Allorhizobium pseudoryzae]
MKLLIVATTLSRAGGGVSEAVRLQALSLAGQAEIRVEALRNPNDAADLKQWGSLDVRVHDRFKGRYALSFSLLRSLLRSNADIVHVHGLWQFPSLAVMIWAHVTGKPYVVTPHGMLEPWIVSRSRPVKKAVSWLYQDRFLKRAAAFQILTEKERSDIAPYLADQIVAEIPNYVPAFSASSEKPAWWRPSFEGRTVYLFFGRIHEKKGCMELAEAWADVCRRDTAFRERSALVFCGWNDGLEGFEGRVQTLEGEIGNILFAGPQYGEDKRRALSSASFFVLPSKSEGLPMAILEAWSAGIPSIMTPECNLLTGFVKGAALETGSSRERIAESLLASADLSPLQREEMGRNAARIVAEDYSKEKVARSLLDLYAGCLRRGAAQIEGDISTDGVSA